MVTRGQRTLGKTIRKIANSVEFSDKETLAKNLEKKHDEELQKAQGYAEDSPIQDLRKIANKKSY
jgi:hypothetical protein